LTNDLLKVYRATNFTANNLNLVGTGVSHDDLIHMSESFRLPEASVGSVARTQAKYLGSEIREENLSEIVHVAVASEGASASSKDALLSSLVSHAFGTGGPRVKYSSGGSKIEKSVSALASNPMAVSSFSANYSDAGLFGFHVVAGKSDIGKVVKGVFRELQAAAKTGFNEQEITRAKNSYKLDLAQSLDSSQGVLEAIIRNPDNAKLNVNELFGVVDAVSATDINAFVKRLAGGKLSLAAIGDLSELPNIDELAAL
jgi:ubiquinol-cytochrome c reductase core subunit 2